MNMERIVKQLTDGLDVHVRQDGKVHRVRAEGHPVAEVVVGSGTVRVNFRDKPSDVPEGLHIGGDSKSWPGGGVQVTEDNVSKVRTLLETVVTSWIEDTNGPTEREQAEMVTLPVRRRGRKMSQPSVEETVELIERAQEEGVLDDVFDSGIAQLLSRRVDAALSKKERRRETAGNHH